jgi:L-amino acid N-acyltransferase YncA
MLRQAGEADLESMREWRNQPVNREVSIYSHEIDAHEHRAWWARVVEDATRQVLVFEYAGRALGVVSFFDLDLEGPERTGAWGFYLDSETTHAEGTTMMAWMQVMNEAISYAFDDEDGPRLDVLTGEVLAGNDAVRAMNRRFRFTEGEPEQRVVDGRRITVHPISLRRENRRQKRGSSS